MHIREHLLDLEILSIRDESVEDIKRMLQGETYDVVNILDPNEKLRAAFKDFVYRPMKITYVLPIPETQEVYLRSLERNKRKRIEKAIKYSQNFALVHEEELQKASFLEWLEIYKKNIRRKKRGRQIACESFFQKNREKLAGIFLKKENKIIGGIIFKKKKRRLSISFSSSHQEFYKASINEYLNVHAIFFAKELNYTEIERGMDNNLYGHHLSPGIYRFKKSLGFHVEPKEKYGRVLTKINNVQKFGEAIFIIGYEGKNLVGHLWRKKKTIDEELFKAPFLKALRVVDL